MPGPGLSAAFTSSPPFVSHRRLSRDEASAAQGEGGRCRPAPGPLPGKPRASGPPTPGLRRPAQSISSPAPFLPPPRSLGGGGLRAWPRAALLQLFSHFPRVPSLPPSAPAAPRLRGSPFSRHTAGAPGLSPPSRNAAASPCSALLQPPGLGKDGARAAPASVTRVPARPAHRAHGTRPPGSGGSRGRSGAAVRRPGLTPPAPGPVPEPPDAGPRAHVGGVLPPTDPALLLPPPIGRRPAGGRAAL